MDRKLLTAWNERRPVGVGQRDSGVDGEQNDEADARDTLMAVELHCRSTAATRDYVITRRQNNGESERGYSKKEQSSGRKTFRQLLRVRSA